MSDERYTVVIESEDFGRTEHLSVLDNEAGVYIVGQFDVVTPSGQRTAAKTVPFMSWSTALLDAPGLFRAIADELEDHEHHKALSRPLELDPEDRRER